MRELLQISRNFFFLHQKGERFINSLRARLRMLCTPEILLEAIYLIFLQTENKAYRMEIVFTFNVTVRKSKPTMDKYLRCHALLHKSDFGCFRCGVRDPTTSQSQGFCLCTVQLRYERRLLKQEVTHRKPVKLKSFPST